MDMLAEPNAIAQFREAGGEVDYSIFCNFSDDPQSLEQAVECHLLARATPYWKPWVKVENIKSLPHELIDEIRFFGDWYDAENSSLRLLGSGNIKGMGRVSDPLYKDLKGCRVDYWGHNPPGIGSGGQYAYAFCCPPHGLGASFDQIQDWFDAINKIILPQNIPSVITDWSSARLGHLSNYFEAGLEWWGVFMFTIGVPEIQQLTVISASTTD